MAKKKKKWYVVWQGRQPGIYRTWDACKAQIHQFAGAQYKAYGSQAEAEAAYAAGGGSGGKAPANPAKVKRDFRDLPPNKRPIVPSIAVDAACQGNPGMLEYRGVMTADKRPLFAHGPVPQGTNNVGEFLALVEALQYVQTENSQLPIYSDSVIAMKWVRRGQCKTTLTRTMANEDLFERIAAAEAWLAANRYDTPIYKWETDVWGEIPADYDRK